MFCVTLSSCGADRTAVVARLFLTFFSFCPFNSLDSGSLNLQQRLRLALELSSSQRDLLLLVRECCLLLDYGAVGVFLKLN